MEEITIDPKKIVEDIIAKKNSPDFKKELEEIISETIRLTVLKTFETNLKITDSNNAYLRRI